MIRILLAQTTQPVAPGPLVDPTAAAAAGAAGEPWVFWIVAPLALAAAIGMIVVRNAVHAALLLVLNFFAIAVLYAVLEAQFLATIQIVVYAGAIMILFLFVLMLLGIDRDEGRAGSRLRLQAPLAIAGGLVLLVGLVIGVAGPFLGSESACGPQATQAPVGPESCRGLAQANDVEGGNVRAVGELLFTRYVWPFEVTSLLLIIAVLGALVLGRRHEAPDDLVDGMPSSASLHRARERTEPAAVTTTEPGDEQL